MTCPTKTNRLLLRTSLPLGALPRPTCLLTATLTSRTALPLRSRKTQTSRAVPEESAPEPVMLRISWRLAQIDYPTCLDYFVLDYYDITYNESTFSRTIERPFEKRIQYDIHSDSVPCDPEFRYPYHHYINLTNHHHHI